MLTRVTDPTPYPDVNAVLDLLLSHVRRVLGKQFVGMYLHGSLASGDFNAQRSDVDFLVATTAELPGEMIGALKAMHVHIRASGLKWAKKLEGPYIPRDALRRYDAARAKHPWLGMDGHFGVEQLGSDWVIQYHVLREHGVVLAGPEPQTLIDPVHADDLRRAVLATLREWWSPPFPSPARFDSSEYQAFAVLTMCRVRYTLQHGTIVPKAVATRWAREAVGEPWVALIEWAWAWPKEAQLDRRDEALDFILDTLERSRAFEWPADAA